MPAEASRGLYEAVSRPEERRDEGALSSDAFEAHLASQLGVARSEISSGTRLVADLGLDSLQMLELGLILDALGACLDAEELDRACRVGDLYRMYVARRTLVRQGELVCVVGTPDGAESPNRTGSSSASPRTRQRPVGHSDAAYLHALLCAEPAVSLSRHRGRAMNPERFAEMLWEGVLAQHLVMDAASNAPIGLLTGYAPDFARQSVKLEIIIDPRFQGRGWPLEAVALFVNGLFRRWPLRKVYAEVLAPSFERIASGVGRCFAAEGRLVAHEYVDGEWIDLHILSVSREHWEADGMTTILDRVLGQSHPVQASPQRPSGSRGQGGVGCSPASYELARYGEPSRT